MTTKTILLYVAIFCNWYFAIVGFPVPDALLCKLLRFLECMLAYFQSTRLNVQSHSLKLGMLKQCIATFHPDLM